MNNLKIYKNYDFLKLNNNKKLFLFLIKNIKMDKKKSNELVYYIKVDSDEETKKKKKKNYNHQNSHKKSDKKGLFSKKSKKEDNNYKSKINSGAINEDSSPTKETLNSPSSHKKNKSSRKDKIKDREKDKEKDKDKERDKEREKEKEKKNNKNNMMKSTPKKLKYSKEKYEEDYNTKNKNKKKRYVSIESTKKIDNDDDLVTSFERKPSELKSPETISEDSFTSSYEEEEELPKNEDKKYKKNKNNKKEQKKKEKKKKDSHTYSELEDNELIYVDKINNHKDDEEIEEEDESHSEEKINKKKNNKKTNINTNKKDKKNNINKNEIDTKESLIEEELKEKERNKKKEKFKNIEIKTKTTTRQTKYVTNLNTSDNNKIIVNKNQKEINTKLSKEVSESNINNNKNLSKNNIDEKSPYIPVNQRKKLVVNKKFIDSKYKDASNTNSLNFLENDIPMLENNKKNEKLFLSNIKNKDKKFLGITKTNTEEKNRYRKKYLNGNCLKESDNNTNEDNLNLENLKSNRASISNRKQKELKYDIENKIFNNIAHTIEITNDITKKNKYKENEPEISKDKIKSENDEKDTQFFLKKNSVLITRTANNKLSKNNPKSSKNIPKKISFNKIVYEPKKLGVIRVRSTKKTGITPLYNNMSYDPNQFLNNKIKDTLSSVNNTLNEKNNESNNYLEDAIFKKNSENLQKKYIELNNSLTDSDIKNQDSLGLLNNQKINNLNTILNSSYERVNSDYNLRNSNNFSLNSKINKSHLFLNKINDKINNGSSSLTNLLNQNGRYCLNNYYDREIQRNNLILNNLLLHHNSSFEFEKINNFRNQTQLINLIGNNFLGPNIVQNNLVNSLNNSNGDINNVNNLNLQNIFPQHFNINNVEQINSNSLSINFEDLIILQEYLREIIISLNKNKVMENECFEFWNYYYNSSICCQLEKLFANQLDSNAVRISINYILMSIMLCYDYSFEKDLYKKVSNTLSEVIKTNYKNLMLICEHILSKITKENLSNIWVLKLSSIVSSSKYNDYSQYLMNGYNMTIVEKISYNTNIIVQNLRYLLKNFKSNRNDSLTSIFKKIRVKTYEEINTFFREKILRITNLNGSILASVFLLKNNNFRTLPAPYVRTKNNKEFSLVLDLDETLIHFKPRNNGEEGGVLRVRPGINEFLDEVGKYYELIIFTTATQDYADVLIDAVEEDKIYFDHRLYREHAVIIDNDFVKDLTRIGRPLEKIIIVDNMPQNFRLQKENGIIIKAFWGEDNSDTVLCDLYPILVNIAKEGGDVRKSLIKYKDEILKNITSCISKSEI